MTPIPDTLTPSVEDYLKAVYRLTAAGPPATTSDIAQQLSISPPSVSAMVRRLAEQGLVDHLPYRGVQLTEQGRRMALRTIRRHRLIEAFLVEYLEYTWDTVHPEAERLEHAVSDTLIDRMAAALGDPEVDPHGDPIPSAEGYIAEAGHTPLAELAPGESARLRRVRVEEPERLRYLSAAGLVPGAIVRVVEREPFAGPITLEVSEERRIIAHELAAELLCEPL